MAPTKTRPRARSTTSARNNGKAPARSNGSPRRAPTRKPRASSGARRGATVKRSSGSTRSRQSRPRGARSGSSASRKSANGATRALTPALLGTAAAAGIAGSVALGSRMLSRRNGGALKSAVKEARAVGKEIGKAGFRVGVGDVSMEVQKGRKEKRDSPIEVLLKGLTDRSKHR